MSVKQPPTKREMLVGYIVLSLIIAGVIVAIGAALTRSSKSAASKPVVSTQQPTPTSVSSKPAPTKKEQMADWFNRYGSSLNLFNGDFDKIGTDAGNNDIAAVGADCVTLSSDTKSALELPALPDTQAASDLSSALTFYQTGADQCFTAASNNDENGLSAAAGVIVKGNNQMKLAIADIKAVQ